jgi:hypothetical protein
LPFSVAVCDLGKLNATINRKLGIQIEGRDVERIFCFPRRVARTEMDEEQPNFKVTDRRLFNSDGSPRELPPDESPEPQAAVMEQPAAAAPSMAQAEHETAPTASHEFDSVEEAEAELGEDDIAGAKDPASFVNFMMSIASNAASALGMMEHPVTHQREVDIELGKHWIDVLGMLEKKTRGNLSAQEQQMLEGLLADLRMQYVSLTSSPPKSVRPFSGSDITGGR